MSQTKRIGGAYTISASGGMTIDNAVTITGNLTVTGTTNSCLLYTSPSPRD